MLDVHRHSFLYQLIKQIQKTISPTTSFINAFVQQISTPCSGWFYNDTGITKCNKLPFNAQ